VTGQNDSRQNGTWTKQYGQNGMDKLAYRSNGIEHNSKDKIILDKKVWKIWYGQSGADKIVATFCIDFNSIEFTKSHK